MATTKTYRTESGKVYDVEQYGSGDNAKYTVSKPTWAVGLNDTVGSVGSQAEAFDLIKSDSGDKTIKG